MPDERKKLRGISFASALVNFGSFVIIVEFSQILELKRLTVSPFDKSEGGGLDSDNQSQKGGLRGAKISPNPSLSKRGIFQEGGEKYMAKKEEKKSLKTQGKAKSDCLAYRLKCTKTSNGLSHFVMYGDVPKEKTLL